MSADDFMRAYREQMSAYREHMRLFSAQDFMRAYRDQMRLFSSTDALRFYGDQRTLFKSQDVLRAYRDQMELFKSQDVLKSYRDQMELFKSAGMSKPYRDQITLLTSQDVFRPYRDALAITPSSLRDLVRDVPDEFRSGAHEPLTEIEDMLEKTPALEPVASTFDWLAWLPPIAQRRMFLLTMGLLLAGETTLSGLGDAEPPAHLDRILLIIAGYLSELIEYDATDEDDG